jgi:ProP effector
MANTTQQKRRRAERTRALLQALIERYPRCFSGERDGVRPLAIGIQEQIREELANAEDADAAPNWLIKQALARYTNAPAYLDAIIAGHQRINLAGEPVAEVTEAAQANARTRRAEQKKRAAERRAASKGSGGKKNQREDAKQRKMERLAGRFNNS